MKYLKNALEVRELKTKDDVKEYLEFRKENDVWVSPYINECAVVGIENIPIFYNQYKENLNNTFNPATKPELSVSLADCTEEDFESCVKDSGLFLVFPQEYEVKIYPTIYTAFSGICQRAGLSGTTITNDNTTTFLSPLPVTEKAAWLTRGFSLHKANCKILIRDEAVVADLSSEYKIIPADKAISALEKELSIEHPLFSYLSGHVSHEYLYLEYILNDDVMENSFRLVLENMGIKVESLKAGVRFSTSDVGNAMVYAAPFYVLNGIKIQLGRGCGCRHDGNGSVETFKEEIKKLGMQFKESEDRIEELGNMDIKYPAGCLQHILDKKAKTLPRKIAQSVLEKALVDYSGGKKATAIDIYILLNDVIEEAKKKKALTPTQIINMSEEVSKLIYINYSDYDLPYSSVDEES